MRRFFRREDPQDDDPNDQYADDDGYDDYGDAYDDEVYDDELDPSAAYQEPDIEPFVPVSGEYYDGDLTGEVESETATVMPTVRRRRIRPRLPRFKLPGLNVDLDWNYLLLALFLFAAGIFGVLLKQDDITGDMAVWWPAALVIAGILWMMIALVRRQVASFLGGSGFAGMGLSLLLETQDIAAVEETILGVVLVTVGLGIVMRGFLLRQQVS